MSISDEEIQQMLISKRKSILSFYKEDILKMKKRGVTLNQIKMWLKQYGIETSSENIRQFCNRYSDNNIENSSKEEKKKSSNNILQNPFQNLNEEIK